MTEQVAAEKDAIELVSAANAPSTGIGERMPENNVTSRTSASRVSMEPVTRSSLVMKRVTSAVPVLPVLPAPSVSSTNEKDGDEGTVVAPSSQRPAMGFGTRFSYMMNRSSSAVPVLPVPPVSSTNAPPKRSATGSWVA